MPLQPWRGAPRTASLNTCIVIIIMFVILLLPSSSSFLRHHPTTTALINIIITPPPPPLNPTSRTWRSHPRRSPSVTTIASASGQGCPRIR
jgi:hypothetical protein